MDEDTWASLKSEIYQLYVVDDETLNTVHQRLVSTHGANLRKTELERQLKVWGFRKNLTKSEWQDLAKILQRREERGKDSEIFLNDVQIPSKRVHRTLLRYQGAAHSTLSKRSTTPPLPFRVRVSTPTPLQISLDIFRRLPILHIVDELQQKLPRNNFQDLRSNRLSTTVRARGNPTLWAESERSPMNVILSFFQQILLSQQTARLDWGAIEGSALRKILPLKLLKAKGGSHDPYLLILQSVLFIASNKLCSSYTDSLTKFWGAFQEIFDISILEAVLEIQCPSSAGLAEILFDYAIESSNVSLLDCSLRCGIDPNVHLPRANSRIIPILPLNRAISLGDMRIFERLISSGADVNGNHQSLGMEVLDPFDPSYIPPASRVKPLSIALGQRNLPMSMMLLEKGALCAKQNGELTMVAASRDLHFCCAELIKALIKAGADVMYVDSQGENIMVKAITLQTESGHTDAVEVEELRDFDVDKDHTLERVKRLNAHGVPLTGSTKDDHHTRSGKKALESAIRMENVTLVEFLLEAGIEASEYAIECVVMTGNAKLADLVFGRVTDILTKRKICYLRLVYAIRHGDIAGAQYLLAEGADVNRSADRADQDFRHHGPNTNKAQEDASRSYKQGLRAKFEDTSWTRYVFDWKGLEGLSGISPITKKILFSQNRRPAYDWWVTDFSPLSAACHQQLPDMVLLLLAQGAHINASRYTALSTAVRTGNQHIVSILLNAGADVNIMSRPDKDHRQETPLVVAIKENNKSMVKLLVQHGALIWERGDQVLDLAVRHNDLELVSYVSSAIRSKEYHFGPDIGPNENSAIHAAIRNQNFEMISQLVDMGFDVTGHVTSFKEETSLFTAVKTNNSTIVHALLELGADSNDCAALAQAVLNGSMEILQLLIRHHSLQYRRKRKFFGCLALAMAIYSDNVDMFQYLLTAGVDPSIYVRYDHLGLVFEEFGPDGRFRAEGIRNTPFPGMPLGIGGGFNALGLAIRQKGDHSVDFVLELLAKHIDVNALVRTKSGHHETALVAALCAERDDLIPLIIDAGADVNAMATYNMPRTALQLAVEVGNHHVVQKLLDAGAKPRDVAAPRAGVTALQAAAMTSHIDIAHELLILGADVNAPGSPEEGRTALEVAAEQGHIDILQLLLNAGAQVHGEGDHQYQRSLEFAAHNRHQGVRMLLEAYHSETKPVVVDEEISDAMDHLPQTVAQTNPDEQAIRTTNMHNPMTSSQGEMLTPGAREHSADFIDPLDLLSGDSASSSPSHYDFEGSMDFIRQWEIGENT